MPPGNKPGHGQKKARRRAIQMTARRMRVWELTLQDKSQREIAAILGINQTTVGDDLRAVESWMKDKAAEECERRFHKKLFRLDRVRRLASDSFDKSLQDRVVKRTEAKRTPPDKDGKSAILELKSIEDRVGQAGDPRFLQVILQADDQESKLLGHNKPAKVAATNPEGDKPADPTILRFIVGAEGVEPARGDG